MSASSFASGPAMELRAVALTYSGPPPVEALKSCSLRVERGEYVAVVGPSGAGKSTFLNIVGLLDNPTEGQYLLDGFDTTALHERERTALRGRRIGFVFQAFHLIPHRTAVENVTLGMVYNSSIPRRKRAQRAQEALCHVGLEHRMEALSSHLSGGERQRVAIARALAGRPAVLLCDELTGNLDSATAEAVLAVLDHLHGEGITLVVITHDPDVASRAQRIVRIHDGALTEVPVERRHDS